MTSTAADVPTVSDDSDFTAGDGAKAGCRPEAVAVEPSEIAVQCAAQCWGTDETKHIEMDARLAMAFARSIDFWIQEAARFHRNETFYRDLIDETGRILGGRVYVQDDGGIVPDVLAMRVPEVARATMLVVDKAVATAMCGGDEIDSALEALWDALRGLEATPAIQVGNPPAPLSPAVKSP